MKFARMSAAVLASMLFVGIATLNAETNANLQSVTATGASAWSGTYSFTVTGVILNNPEDMLDYTYDSSASANGTMGAQWQLFIQGVSGDHAGTALWMGQNYNSLGAWIPAGNAYDESAWLAEMLRINYDSATGAQFRAGDLVTITVNVTAAYGGKRNINEGHRTTSANDFTISLVQAGYGLPEADVITISDLFASTSCTGYNASYPMFDQTRTTGAEYYQGTYVLLTGLTLTDSSGWGETAWADRICTVVDEYGNEFTLRMPLSDLGEMPTGEFSAYGIINQESGSSAGLDGYELFVTSVVPEPCTLSMLLIPVMAILKRRRKSNI